MVGADSMPPVFPPFFALFGKTANHIVHVGHLRITTLTVPTLLLLS